MKLKTIPLLLTLPVLMLLVVACGGGTESLPDIEATAEARVAVVDIDATVEAKVNEVLTAVPTAMAKVVVKEVPVEKIVTVVVTATPTPTPTQVPPTPTPTPMPTATPTPIPTPTPIVHEFSGTGNRVLGPIMLEPGVLVLVAGHNGQSNFIVQIVGASGSEEYSINEIGRYSGVRAHAVSSGSSFFGLVSGAHRIQVQADGPWTLELKQERPSGGAPPPISDEGDGDNVLTWLNLRKGQYVLTTSHDGQSNFIVELLKSDGSQAEYLVNEIGVGSGEALIQVGSGFSDLNPGLYAFVVQADGHWTMVIK